MADIEALRTQEYAANVELLSQQMRPKLALYSRTQSATGSKALRMLSQIGSTEVLTNSTRAAPAMDVRVDHDGRWVFPTHLDWGTVIDDIDLLQTNIAPQGAYVTSAVAAANRKKDELFLTAFFGTSLTGETGGTSTAFDSGNVVAVTEGVGAATGLNVAKLRAAKKILLENEVDLDMEQIYVGITPKQHDDLLAITQVVSTDFNDRPVLGTDGFVNRFLGMNFVISNRLGVDGSSYRRLPVWVPSGMGRGVWQETTARLRKRSDLQREPMYAELMGMEGYTRIEEAKCVEIKCAE